MKKVTILIFMLFLSGVLAQSMAGSLVDLTEYTGTYKVTDLPFEKVLVSVKENKLHYMAGEYEGDFTEVAGKPDTYNTNNGSALVTFVRNEAGKVLKMKLEIDGSTFEGTKEQATLTDYVGTYKVTGLPFDKLVLTVVNDQLHVVAGDNEGTLTPVANQADTFDAAGQAILKFKRDAQNNVTTMVLEAQGQSFESMPVVK